MSLLAIVRYFLKQARSRRIQTLLTTVNVTQLPRRPSSPGTRYRTKTDSSGTKATTTSPIADSIRLRRLGLLRPTSSEAYRPPLALAAWSRQIDFTLAAHNFAGALRPNPQCQNFHAKLVFDDVIGKTIHGFLRQSFALIRFSKIFLPDQFKT